MSKGKILVVDDSPLVRKLAEVSLAEAGYDVFTADNGEEGLRIAESIKPDLILVDFIMPKMTGSQFCKLIRDNENLKDIPIILITGKGETVGQTFVEKYNVLDYFIKPFKSEDLVAKVDFTLAKQAEALHEVEEKLEIQAEEKIEEVEFPEIEKIISELELQPQEEKIKEPEQEIPSIEIPALEEEKLFEDSIPSLEIVSEEEPLIELKDFAPFEEIKIEPPQEEIQQVITPEGIDEAISVQESSIFEIEENVKIFEESFIDQKAETEEVVSDKKLEKTFNIDTMIEERFKKFKEELFSILEITIENILKKHGLLKTDSVLSGSLEFLKFMELLNIIKANRLTGLLNIFLKGICYEILCIDGDIVYAISNLQRQKIGSKLLSDISEEEIKQLTKETLSAIRNLSAGDFNFEKKDFSDQALLSRKRYSYYELV